MCLKGLQNADLKLSFVVLRNFLRIMHKKLKDGKISKRYSKKSLGDIQFNRKKQPIQNTTFKFLNNLQVQKRLYI